MLVRHNLLLATGRWVHGNNKSQFNHIKFIIDQGDLISGKNYIVKGKIEQTGAASGQFSIGIGDEKDVGWYIEDKVFNVGAFSYKFTYLPNRMKYFYIYTDVREKTYEIGAIISEVALYEETRVSDIYLPNINNLLAGNKPLLPPEGDYKVIYPA